MTNLTIQQGGQTFGSSDFRLVDFAGNKECREIPRGSTIDFFLQVNTQSTLNFNEPFTVLYNGQVVVDFPKGLKPGIGTSTTSLNFRVVPVNSVSQRIVLVTNTGSGTLTGLVQLPSGSPFSVIGGKNLNLAAGASQGITVQFAPITPGRFDEKVTLETNAGTFAVLVGGQCSADIPCCE